MKKILATLLASAMALSFANVAFAKIVDDMPPPNSSNSSNSSTVGSSGDTIIAGEPGTASASNLQIKIPMGAKGEVDLTKFTSGTFPIFTYGTPDDVEFSLVPVFTDVDGKEWSNAKFKNLSAHVNSGNVSVTIKKNSSTTWKGGSAPVVKVKATSGGRDFNFDEDLNDLSIDLDMSMVALDTNGKETGNKVDTTLTLKADESTAYSKTQELLNDEDITLSKANGTIVKFGEAISEKTRVRASDYVDVFFKGNYGTNKQNLRVVSDSISEIDTYFEGSNTNIYDFAFTPKFASTVKVAIDADQNAVIYEYNKKTGDITKVETAYDSNSHTFETKALTCYIVSDEEYENGNVNGDVEDDIEQEEIENNDTTDTTTGTEGDKENPSTGASDMAGAAAAMAILSLTGVGAVMIKKASK